MTKICFALTLQNIELSIWVLIRIWICIHFLNPRSGFAWNGCGSETLQMILISLADHLVFVQFWSTQPVPSLDDVITSNEPINPDPPVDKVGKNTYRNYFCTISLFRKLLFTKLYNSFPDLQSLLSKNLEFLIQFL